MSEQYYPISTRGIKAAADIVKQRFIGYNLQQVAVVGGRARGVSMNDALTGRDCDLIERGSAPVVSGGVFAAGEPIMSDAQGRAVLAANLTASVDVGATPVTSTAANGAIITLAGANLPQHVLGVALEASTGADEIHEIDLWR